MSQQQNPKETWVALNTNAGAMTVVRLSTWAKYVAINEDPSQNGGVKQGLQYNRLDYMAQSSNITANSEPQWPLYGTTPVTPAGTPELEFGDKHNIHSGTSLPLGNPGSGGNVDNPGGQATLGTPLVQLRSATATATTVIVKEYA